MRIEVRGDMALFRLRSTCGLRTTRTVALPEGQTPEERLAALRKRFPSAEIVVKDDAKEEME